MREVERQLDRILTLLRNKIRQQGFTQLEVQEVLGWGRSYISQLLTKQKSLRVEQVLLILNVIGVDSAAFFAELYPPGTMDGLRAFGATDGLRAFGATDGLRASGATDLSGGPLPGGQPDTRLRGDYRSVRALLRGLVDLLVNQEVISAEELAAAVHDSNPLPGEDN